MCPQTDGEWQTLVDYLGGDDIAGGKMKEVGTSRWSSPNTGATNESRFSALPCSFRTSYNGMFTGIGPNARFWSSSRYGIEYAWYRALRFNSSEVFRGYYYKQAGFSIRLVKD